ncbi:DivIVA domain-containing protein [Micromonospora globbae]|uniref:DivIVA domain-containing protein n=1 Tax=Micromonospora globbae TaxID=1894969 RepID=A0A420F4Z2_9ACTN|nr:DivIVA domain-containing protein [Micromonospora globbae]RKF27986.1 DivIVA domain-containing protein [Micromonospora globbae]
MGQVLLVLVVALTVAAVVFGVAVLVTGRDPGLVPAEPDGRAVPLPGNRPLQESDLEAVRFDTALRGYRMAQVDQALRRAAYDIGYKSELIGVLEAEVAALREGRTADADALRRAREQAAGTAATGTVAVGAAAATDAVTAGTAAGGESPAGADPRADGTAVGRDGGTVRDPDEAADRGDGPVGPGTVVRSESV